MTINSYISSKDYSNKKRLVMLKEIIVSLFLLVILAVAGFSGYLNSVSVGNKLDNTGGLSGLSLGQVCSFSWGNWQEYVFVYNCMKEAGSPDPDVPDGMRILEVMTLITYKGKVYAVLSPVGEIWSFNEQNWTVSFIWSCEPHPNYRWRGGAWSALIFQDKLYFFGFIMHSNGACRGYGIRFDGQKWDSRECDIVGEFYSAEVYQNNLYCAGVVDKDAYIFKMNPDSLEFTLIHVESEVGVPAFMSTNRWSEKLYVATGCWEHGERMINARNPSARDVYAHLLVFDGANWRKHGLPSEEGFESVTVDDELGVVVGASSGVIYRFMEDNSSFRLAYDLGKIHPIKMFGAGGNVGKDWIFDYLWVCGGSRWYFKPIGGKIVIFNNGEWHELSKSLAVGFSDVETFGSWILIATVWPRDHTRVSVLVFPATYFTHA